MDEDRVCTCAAADVLRALEFDPAERAAGLERFLRANVDRFRRDGILFGLSGGVDSAVVATLCVRAVGAERVLALRMPDRDSNPAHDRDAEELARELGIETRRIDLTPHLEGLDAYQSLRLLGLPVGRAVKGALIRQAFGAYRQMTKETPFVAGMVGVKEKALGSVIRRATASYRIKHRLRMVLLYLHAEMENRLVVGAANKTEAQTGFFVKHGCDHCADVMPLLGLYKTQVVSLARHLGVPGPILDKPPSPDVLPGLNDEDVIGVPYAELDRILIGIEHGCGDEAVADAAAVTEEQVGYVRRLLCDSEHMRHVYAPGDVP